MPYRVFGDLNQYRIAGFQRVFDFLGLTIKLRGIPVDLTGIQDGVAPASNINERRLHGWQNVLHLAEVDVADQRVLLGIRYKVFSEDPVFEYRNLDLTLTLTDEHLAFNGFPPGQEFGF